MWFALIAAKDCGGDLDLLAPQLSQSKPYLSSNRESAERKISHLRDMQSRLLAAGITPAEIVAAAGDLVRGEARRARSRVLGDTDREREWSEAMRITPRQRRRQQALRGFWPRFPVSPQADADQMASEFRTRNFFTAEQSFGLARRIQALLEGIEAGIVQAAADAVEPAAADESLPPVSDFDAEDDARRQKLLDALGDTRQQFLDEMYVVPLLAGDRVLNERDWTRIRALLGLLLEYATWHVRGNDSLLRHVERLKRQNLEALVAAPDALLQAEQYARDVERMIEAKLDRLRR